MTMQNAKPGQFMAAEAAEAQAVFAAASQQRLGRALPSPRAIYTVARGSSDAAANILSYEFMRELQIPMTSLPPSIFSLGNGIALSDAMVLVISQSGASDDLVRTARGAKAAGAEVLAITNQPDSPVEAIAATTVPIGAGPERAVPATKTVCGAIGAGIALLATLKPHYRARADASAKAVASSTTHFARADAFRAAFLRARHVYVIGRDTGYGAAIEVALKLKECCALHAEAYSSSEVLHGPLQLATNPLTVLILDTGAPDIQDSLDQAEARFAQAQCDVLRLRPSDLGTEDLTQAAAAALLLAAIYPIILSTALALGHDPDAPETLSKVTRTT